MPDAELLRRARGYPLAFPPGSRFHYSNVGYRLLAMVAERTTGAAWPAFLHGEVFAPATMAAAGVFEPNAPAPPDLVGGRFPYRCHALVGGPCMIHLPRWNYSALWGAGAVHLRASDLLAWAAFLARLRRDEPAFFASYTRVGRDDYAAGIGNKTLVSEAGERVRVHSHTGEDPGYDASFAWFPETESVADATLVVLSNTDYGPTGSYALGDELRALVAGQRVRVVD